MPFDGIFLSKLCDELRGSLIGGRVDKVHQPSGDVLVLFWRAKTGNSKMLLNLSASPRLYLTGDVPENPAVPPRFCMLLRKHLGGARLAAIETAGYERVCTFVFEGRSEMGDAVTLRLTAELIAGRANAILIGNDGRILDALRHSDPETSERLLLPGALYRLPDPPKKRDPAGDPASLAAAVAAENDELWHALLTVLAGCSPALARDLSARVTDDVTRRTDEIPDLVPALEKVFSAFGKRLADPPAPTLLLKDGAPADFFWYPPVGGVTASFPSLSAVADRFYREKQHREQASARSARLRKTVSTVRARLARKLEARKNDLASCAEAELCRVKGELLKANLHTVPRGAPFVDLPNYYADPPLPLRVTLDPALSPADNAGRYFKEYKKKKTAQGLLDRLIAETEAELTYLDSIAEALERADTAAALEEIRAELTEAGYCRVTGAKKRPQAPAAPARFLSPGGFEVLVGKNNLQNDRLTLHTAEKTDLWFHTKAVHGSHVILRTEGNEPDEADRLFAAGLAAYHSKARYSSGVAVDCTRVKFVKKPAGARPGMVIYTDQKTYYVTPSAPPEK